MKHALATALLTAVFLTPAIEAVRAEPGPDILKVPRRGTKAYAAMAGGYQESIAPVLEAKCADCHTTRTRFPWYYRMPLAKGMIDLDIRKARKALDLTGGFPFAGVGTTADHVSALRDVALDGSMPPFRYVVMHWSAKLTKAERDSIVAWAEGKPPNALTKK